MITLQDVLRQFHTGYQENHPLSTQQAKAFSNIMDCRTAALGGRVYQCSECTHASIHYNSCRNRHCPMCQGVNRSVWVDQRNKDILDAPYFHVVFTMPKQLQPLVYQNQKMLYSLMYKAVAQTLAELALDEKYLGAQIGFFSVLHTWGQDLHYHPHIHTVVLAGGLTESNNWRCSGKKFFIPVKVLAKKFRGKYLYYLKQYYNGGLLNFHGDTMMYQDPRAFMDLINQCYKVDWYVYSKETFSGPLAVVRYLGRYTHRIAISNNRIVAMDEGTVTFRVKGEKSGGEERTVTLQGVEFIRRFLMHVLPKGFVKIRYYGILANRNKKTKLALCRKLTLSPVYKPKFEGLGSVEIISILLGRDVTVCTVCKKGQMELVREIIHGAFP